jgi:F-type H+-transporting ATPase subunit b
MEVLFKDFSPGLFIMQVILLLIIIFLLRKFAWKPILDALDSREEGIKNALESAEEARKALADLEVKNNNLLAEARAERDSMIKDAKATADKMVEEAKNKAKEEAEKVLENARISINAEKVAAVAELKTQMAAFSIEIAEKIVRENLSSDEKQKALAGKLAEEINLN